MSNTVLLIVQFGVRQCTFYHFQLCDLWSLLGSFFICTVDFTAPRSQGCSEGGARQREPLGLGRKSPGRWENCRV